MFSDGTFSDGMFSDGMFSDGMFSDGTFSDGTFVCESNKGPRWVSFSEKMLKNLVTLPL